MTSDSIQSLDLAELNQGLTGLTPIVGAGLVEACSVCLDHQGHSSGVQLTVSGPFNQIFQLLFPLVTDQMRRTWDDLQDATEDGACGIAILLIITCTDYTVVKRARKTTGIDYWLGYDSDPLFQYKARLEVSGILKGKESTVTSRTNVKLNQIKRSDNTQLPAYIVIVEFNKPLAKVTQK